MEQDTFYKKLISTENLAKKDWLKVRQSGIGGSDISSVCGINPYKSALALYYEKTQEVKEDDVENLPAELGTYLEPFMKVKFEDWWKKNKGGEIIEVESMPFILQHSTNKIALANLDGFFGDKLVEYKTTSERNYKQWEEDNLPDYYYLQTQWYLYVTDFRYCYIAFLIGNRKFDVKLIERNEEVIKQIVEKADYFWNTFVIPRIPPAPSGDESSGETLKAMYPKEEEGKVITLDVEKNLAVIENLAGQIKDYVSQLEIEKQYIKSLMKEAEVAICGSKKIKWKEEFKKGYTVQPSSSRVFRISKNQGGNLNGN